MDDFNALLVNCADMLEKFDDMNLDELEGKYYQKK